VQADIADRESRGDAIGRGESENRAAGQHQRMHAPDEIFGRQRFGFAHARAAAPHIDAGRPFSTA
jgi:hypothetical protein